MKYGPDFSCADCGKVSPPTEEGETISKQHGWRISRKVLGELVVIEPRCPECFARFRVSLPPDAGGRRPKE